MYKRQGIVPVPDERLDKLAAIVNPERILPTTFEFVDIAGLVAGASKGEGLGNQFLANIRESDAIAHVVRCFENDDVIHVAGTIDPLADIEVIQTELALADMASLEKAVVKATKASKSGNKDELKNKVFLEKVLKHLDETMTLRSLEATEDELLSLAGFQLLTLKPMLYIANVQEDGFENNPFLDKVTSLANEQNAAIVAVCAAMEAEIIQLEEDEREEFLEEMGLTEPGLNRVIRAGYELLNLQTYFTAGEKEVRAWTVKKGATAPQAAGVIHTDFEKGFIRAEITAYDDFVEYNGEKGAKEAGKLTVQGKEYIMQDGDVTHFRFNV